jgi:hypothetical protein
MPGMRFVPNLCQILRRSCLVVTSRYVTLNFKVKLPGGQEDSSGVACPSTAGRPRALRVTTLRVDLEHIARYRSFDVADSVIPSANATVILSAAEGW